ncbi:Replication initiator protein A (plasmid) [Deinococcus proteolyticus MRP]|uniref:Replication initiator protein A n=1 Tax=Deinococcus proteolyticus (strain ATCC 35074 / DSM 20540 / JCM 6276 / NBRC 101906 / NCIMB 13154 / VKM Ac-1939 / CCM 2703 / MRP) TaxID=693977 RepID=F0RPW7_DEIPM|nr:Replication initiator protein A [Deinococcus proteolyticus MRP]
MTWAGSYSGQVLGIVRQRGIHLSRSGKLKAVPPTPPAQLDRFDEANSARLGLICVQERIPDDYTRWDIEFMVDERPARLTCISPGEYGGVPHGLDGDFATILNVMYLEQGAPESGIVHTTAYQLLQRAGFPDSGQYYQSLQESLDRLKAATYTASESWRDHKRQRWTTVKFNIIERITAETQDGLGFGSGTTLKIQLARPVVESIREKYLKPLDMSFVLSLKRSLTRSLYRVLDAHRYQPGAEMQAAAEFRINLQQWARECKLRETVPARIKRNLESAHKELLERGYLSSVDYEGARGETVIIYRFGDLPTSTPAPEPVIEVVPDAPVTDALRRYGVAPTVARKLVSEYGEALVTQKLEKFEAMIKSGYQARKKSALLVDVIRDISGKYADPEGYQAEPKRAEASLQAASIAKRIEAEEAQLNRQLEKEFLGLDKSEQAARALNQVRMFIGREVSEKSLKALLKSMHEGEVEPYEIYRTVIRAASELRLGDFAHEIREAYGD